MKKIYFLITCLLVIVTGVGIYNTTDSETKTEKEPSKEIRVREAIEWENFMREDPALGYVPHDRMLDVYRRIDVLNNQASSRTGDMADAKWRERGPYNVGGRTRAIMIDKNDVTGNTIFAAGVTGGLWKTTNISDSRPNWVNIGDSYDNLNVCALAQNPNNKDEMYFGTGEPFGGAGRGLGIWKSTDGGDTWTHLPSTANALFYTVVRLLVHPITNDIYATTISGGLQRSQDQGATWTKVLGIAVSGGTSNASTDLEYSKDGDIYITIGGNQVYTSPAGANQGDVGSWTRLTTTGSGFPTNITRVELAVAPSNNNMIYASTAVVVNGETVGGPIYKSLNKGVNWAQASVAPTPGGGNYASNQAWYDLDISVDPTNPNIVIIGGVVLLRSLNGGGTWSFISNGVHADQHFMVWDKDKPGRFFLGNDGGVYMSSNKGVDIFSKDFGYNTTQFYAHSMHPDKYSNYFLAGSQDNGTQQFDSYEIDNTESALGGDGFMTHIDQNEPDTQFVSLYYGDFYMSQDGGESFGQLFRNPDPDAEFDDQGIQSRFYTPSDYDNDANILYAQAANNGAFFRWSVSEGGGFISGPINKVGTTVDVTNFSSQVTHVHVSALVANRLYLGSTAGRIYKVDNADVGTSVSATLLNLPTSGNISCIVESESDPNHLIATLANYGINSIWETNNGGTNWHTIEGDLPDVPVNWVAFHPYDNDKLFIATDAGVWVTEDINGGNTEWDISSKLPVVRSETIETRTSDGLISVGTYGRGLFSTAYLSPVLARMRVGRVTYLESSSKFTDLSINAQKWLWDFGDGTTSSIAEPTHEYNAVNSYDISLTVNDTVVLNDMIKVLPDRGTPYTTDASIYGGNFDEHDEDFGVDLIAGTGWEKGVSTIFAKDGAHSGNTAYVTGLDDQYYEHNTESYLYTPNFDLSEPAIYEFKFWGKYNIQQGFDGFNVEYSLDRGQSWSQLGVQRNDVDDDLNNWYNYTSTSDLTAFFSGSSYFTGYQPVWREFKTDLNALVGNSDVAFRFVFKTNETNRQQGIAVDDVQVTKYDDILETILRSFEGEFKTPSSSEVILNWTTQPEYLCKGFTYFVSENGKDFIENTTLIPGQGSTADLTTYAAEIFNRNKSLYYFKLKVINDDDTYFISDVIVVNRDGSDVDLEIKVFPNPIVGDLFSISFNQALEETTNISIYDAAGRLVISEIVQPGEVFTEVGTAKLQNGVYIIVFESGEDRVVRRVMKMD